MFGISRDIEVIVVVDGLMIIIVIDLCYCVWYLIFLVFFVNEYNIVFGIKFINFEVDLV